MKPSPKIIPFLQALGVTIYVTLFALLVNLVEVWSRSHPSKPMFGIIIFLMVFVISALICGGIVLGYPIMIFFEGKKHEAFKMVVFTGLWMALFLTVFVLILSIRS
jgi:hypothetical protein